MKASPIPSKAIAEKPWRLQGRRWERTALCLAALIVFGRLCEAETGPGQGATGPCTLSSPFGTGQKHAVRLWIRGDDARSLGSGVVTVSRADGSMSASIDCAGPSVLMRLPPGRYIATIDAAAGPTRNVSFSVGHSVSPRTIDVRLPPGTALLRGK